MQQQLLDVLVIRREEGDFVGRLPDGLEELRSHNLLTFKSHHQALNGWALKELASHSVAYRKLVSRSPSELLPEDQFGLFAVSARFPQQLSSQVPLERVGDGVYNCRWAVDLVRVIVAGELPKDPWNAGLHVFSARPDLIEFGRRSYRPRTGHASVLLGELFEGLQGEGLGMPFTMEDFQRQYARDHFPRLPREEQREVMQSLPLEVRLSTLTDEERLAGLTEEQRLAGLTQEQIRQYLDRLNSEKPPEGEH